MDATTDKPLHSGRFGDLTLLPESHLVKTGPVDHAPWNYRGILGAIQRRRFKLISRLMGGERFGDLLEVGYGSGIFAPELSRRSDRLSGIDIHDNAGAVSEALGRLDIEADLRRGGATELPFEAGSFDAVVAVSVLEFIDDHDRACDEIARVLRPGGKVFVVTPGYSPVLDFGLKFMTGESAKKDFGDRREKIIPALIRRFRIVKKRDYPLLSPLGTYVYRSLELEHRGDRG